MATIATITRNTMIFPNFNTSILSLPSSILFFPSSISLSRTSRIHLSRSLCGSPFNQSRSFSRCRAGTSGPPPPPSGNELQSNGITTKIIRVWDMMQIFFAVFVWMSLFFWASASNRNNTGGGNKGNRFRK